MKTHTTGRLYGVGLGPGDPELMTRKAARLVAGADVVSYFHAPSKQSIARKIIADVIPPDAIEEPLAYPVTTGTTTHEGGYRGAMDDFYQQCTVTLAAHLDAGRDVVVVSEGDPLTYGSYQHLHRRLRDQYHAEVVPGVTSFAAAAAAHGEPLVEDKQTLTIMPGTLPSAQLVTHLSRTDGAVIMKLGRNAAPVQTALADAGRLEDALYAERVGHAQQRLGHLANLDPAEVPYMALALIPAPDPATLRAAAATADHHSGDLNTTRRHSPGAVSAVGDVTVVGLGPGPDYWRTPAATEALARADVVLGYATYVGWVPVAAGQERVATDNTDEMARATDALERAKAGQRVAMVSSGDPGVFAMATAVVEAAAAPQYSDVPVAVEPGVTAASAAAARFGAPLGHDFAVISLSTRLKNPETVLTRVRACARADLAMAWYNPASRTRREEIRAAAAILREEKPLSTPVMVARSVGRPGESLTITTVEEFDPETIDMACIVLVGTTETALYSTNHGERVYTSREYTKSLPTS